MLSFIVAWLAICVPLAFAMSILMVMCGDDR
jgi:hypothetical protein